MAEKRPMPGETVEVRLGREWRSTVVDWISIDRFQCVRPFEGSYRDEFATYAFDDYETSWRWPKQPFAEHAEHQWTTADGWWWCDDCKVHLIAPTPEEKDRALRRFQRG